MCRSNVQTIQSWPRETIQNRQDRPTDWRKQGAQTSEPGKPYTCFGKRNLGGVKKQQLESGKVYECLLEARKSLNQRGITRVEIRTQTRTQKNYSRSVSCSFVVQTAPFRTFLVMFFMAMVGVHMWVNCHPQNLYQSNIHLLRIQKQCMISEKSVDNSMQLFGRLRHNQPCMCCTFGVNMVCIA